MINSLEININKEEKEFILERIEKILDSKINKKSGPCGPLSNKIIIEQ